MAFAILEGDHAILAEKGVYRQCDLYTHNGQLFAKIGGGFVRLNEDGSSSKPHVRLEELATEAPLYRDRFGRLALAPGEGRTRIPGASTRLTSKG